MTILEALASEGGMGKVYIHPLKIEGVLSYLTDDEEQALVVYSLEKHGRILTDYFYLDQLKLVE